MNIFTTFLEDVKGALHILHTHGILKAPFSSVPITVEPPKDRSHGDATTNAALVLAKSAGCAPRVLAQALVDILEKSGRFSDISIAGPGFINVRFKEDIWKEVLHAILTQGPHYGRSTLGVGKRVNVEFVSANPTGPLHIGHCRGAVFGDALCRLLGFAGYEVTREYYVNDAGNQVDILARSVHLRYQEALLGHSIEIGDGLYPGDYLIPLGQELARRHGDRFLNVPQDVWLPPIKAFATERLLEEIKADLATLSIAFDVFFSEKSLHDSGAITRLLEELEARDLVYTGSLPPPKGDTVEDWEDREQVLFRASRFGDDGDRPLVKSDGSYTYFAADVAYAQDKIARGFDRVVYILGADHGGYVPRLKAVYKALTDGRAPVEVDAHLCQLVKLFRDGAPLKMSKRAGTFVGLRDLVEEVGPDVVRFIMLFRKNDAQLDFDFQKVLEQSKDNPVFYVQYAHARLSSVLRKVPTDQAPWESDFSLLTDPHERALIEKMAQYPRTIELCALANEPHRLAFYLHDLAALFHGLWNRGKDNPDVRFLRDDDPDLTRARLALLRACQIVFQSTLTLLGVTPLEEM